MTEEKIKEETATEEQERTEDKETPEGAEEEKTEPGEDKEEEGEPEPEEETLAEEDEALESRYLRLMADFQNYKKRTEKEKADVYAYANESICLKLLGVMDNFERALEHMEDGNDPFCQGMEMIFKQLRDVLSESHVEEIDALGKEFDPQYHNAVMMEETEGTESNTVTEVLQKGYTLNAKVIRPAMVKVAK